MPYDIRRNYGGCRGYAVVGGSGIHGCHTTRRSAVEQQRALYAAENAKKMQDENERKDKKKKEIHKSWSIIEGHPECDGFALVGSHGDLKSCHQDMASAESALAQHNQDEANGVSDGNDNMDDSFDHVQKASNVKVGDMVSWNSSGGRATGRVEHVMRDGVLGIPNSEFSIRATSEDPAVLIRIYRDGKATETLVGHKMSTLTRVGKSEDGVIGNNDTPNKNPHSMEDCNDPNCPDHSMDKRDYSLKERQTLARRDMALPDGSFPIVTVADLRNAIQSVGRASNYSKARNHIIRRAEALGRTDLLPEEWKPKAAKKAFEMTKRDVSDIDLRPTESMASNARRGLELRDKFNRGGTAVGVARARDLMNRRELSPETVARMYSFFSRHEVDKKGKDWDNPERPSNGKIAWLLWGGDSGYAWAKQKWEAIQNARASKSDETWKDSPFSFYK